MNISSIAVAAPRGSWRVALIAALSGGCYLLQSAEGQLALMSKREPIAQRHRATRRRRRKLRTQLEAVAAIRDFASRELGLPDNGSYRSYADVGRRYVVWNVVAAPEFSVDAEGMVLSHRRLRGVPRLFRRGRARAVSPPACAREDSTSRSAASRRIRRWGTSTIRF